MPNPLIDQALERFKNKYCSFELVEVVKKRDHDRLAAFLRTELQALEKAVREEENGKEKGRGYFEVVQDEQTGRKYWFGAEEGWKDPEEIGEKGVITIDVKQFEVGTVITMTEPFTPTTESNPA